MTSPTPDSHAVRRNTARHRFELEQDGEVVAFLDYRELGSVLDLVHTEVDPRHEGQGHAGRLVRGVLEEARRTGQRVRPSCSYVAAWLERHPDFADVVAS